MHYEDSDRYAVKGQSLGEPLIDRYQPWLTSCALATGMSSQ